jgi:hypothetical protein
MAIDHKKGKIRKRVPAMKRTIFILLTVLLLTLAFVSPAAALKGKADFQPHIYADGVAWGTKVTAMHKAPNGHNDQSYDKLFIITNGVEGQLPVGEAAPGNPMYNGGRWWTHTVEWQVEPHATLTFYEYKGDLGPDYDPVADLQNLAFHVALGHLDITDGSPDGGPPHYFSCPLLPVK